MMTIFSRLNLAASDQRSGTSRLHGAFSVPSHKHAATADGASYRTCFSTLGSPSFIEYLNTLK